MDDAERMKGVEEAFQKICDALSMTKATPEAYFRTKMCLLYVSGAVFAEDVKELEAIMTRWQVDRPRRQAEAN